MYLETITVEVRQVHIDTGIRLLGGQCPIALAIADKGLSGVTISSYESHWFSDSKWQCAILPDDAVRFVKAFDNHRVTKPFTFQLRPIVEG